MTNSIPAATSHIPRESFLPVWDGIALGVTTTGALWLMFFQPAGGGFMAQHPASTATSCTVGPALLVQLCPLQNWIFIRPRSSAQW